MALAAAVADWSSSVDRREGFLSRARRVAVWQLRSGKGVNWGGDAVVGSDLVASAVLDENLNSGEEAPEGLEMAASAVFREGVGGGKNVAESACEEVVASLPAETLTPSVDEAGVVVPVAKLAILAPIFSPDIVALFERFCVGFIAHVYCQRVQVCRDEPRWMKEPQAVVGKSVDKKYRSQHATFRDAVLSEIYLMLLRSRSLERY